MRHSVRQTWGLNSDELLCVYLFNIGMQMKDENLIPASQTVS
jgi:hypothetical protein